MILLNLFQDLRVAALGFEKGVICERFFNAKLGALVRIADE